MDGKEKTTTYTIHHHFSCHLIALDHPSPSSSSGTYCTHLPFWSSPGAHILKSKGITDTAAQHAKQPRPFLRTQPTHTCFHYLSSSSSSLLFTVWALLSLVIFCRR